MLPPPPYELVGNDQTWLEQTDLVFIDPVGPVTAAPLNQKSPLNFSVSMAT